MGFPRRFPLLALAALLCCVPVLSCDSTTVITVASMSATSATLTGTVGQGVTVSVTVTGSDGAPYAGAVVTFSVTSGGGSVSPATAASNSSGRATTTWTLGQSVGTQTLSASLEGYSATFTADAQAGSPASVEAMTTFPGTFDPATALPQAVVFEVEDEFSNKVPGVTVSFSASDGGSADPSSATTDSQGQVSTTWTLGPNNGTQTLTATAGSSTGSATAEAYDPCQDIGTINLDETIQGSVTLESCEMIIENELRLVAQYYLTIQTQTAVVFDLVTDWNGPNLQLWDRPFDDPYDAGKVAWWGGGADNHTGFKIILDASTPGALGAPGQGHAATTGKTYLLRAASREAQTGNLTLSAVERESDQFEDDSYWLATSHLDIDQTISETDRVMGDGIWGDRVQIHLEAGERIFIEERSTDFSPDFRIKERGAGKPWAYGIQGDDSGHMILDYTAPARNYYWLYLTTLDTGATGAYNVKITPVASTGPGGAPR
jgi:hypothetical protein